MKNKIIMPISTFLIVYFVLNTFMAFSQIPNDMIKYWYYRNRLNNYFVLPGEQRGESQIVCIRNIIPNWWSNGNVKNLEYGQHGKYTGIYLGVLATEYYLLSINGQYADATKTQDELHKALMAVKVFWDEAAEEYWEAENPPFIISNHYNGFFIRGNVPCDFFNDNLPRGVTSNGISHKKLFNGVYFVKTEYDGLSKTIKLVINH
jgi:hypothetical protein